MPNSIEKSGIKTLPSWEEMVHRYNLDQQAERDRLSTANSQKYTPDATPQLSLPPKAYSDTYGDMPAVWGYYGGTVVHNQPLYSGNLESRVGLDKAMAHWRDGNNDVGLTLGAGGNHSINWTHSF